MSTTRFQLNLDPLQTNKKELMVSHAAKVSKHVDIFEVPESHVDIIKELQEAHKGKSFLVKVSSLDANNIARLAAAGVNMISFVGTETEDFDFTQFDNVKFVADMTNVYKTCKYDFVKIKLIAAMYLNKNVNVFNLNIDSVDEISLVAPLVRLQSVGAKVSIHIMPNNSIVDKIIKSRVNIIAILETPADIKTHELLNKQLVAHNKRGDKIQEEILKEEASLETLEYTRKFMKEDKSRAIDKLKSVKTGIQLINTNKYILGQLDERIDELRVSSNMITDAIIDDKISTTNDLLNSLREAKSEFLGEMRQTEGKLEKITPKVQKIQKDWYGRQYVKSVNVGKVFKILIDIEADFAKNQ